MDFNEYQDFTQETAIYPGQGELQGLLYAILGLCGESGELANKAKKVLRDNNGEITEEFVDFAGGELGDILYYIARVCTELKLDLNMVAKYNREKLLSRKERGVIKGNGDNR